MRRLAPLLLLLTLTACAATPVPAESTIGQGYPAEPEWPQVGPQSLAKWESFPVQANPRPLVLLGQTVNIEQGFADGDGKLAFSEGRIDPDGKVPPDATEAFAKLVKPGAGEPRIKVISVVKGTAKFPTDRGPRDLPAWIFELTKTVGPVTVLDVKPNYQGSFATTTATLSPDGMTLTIPMGKPQEPCPGEPRVTHEAQWLESPTAVAVGLKKITGEVAPGQRGNCAHDMALRLTDYTIRLDKPLGNRVLIDANGNAISVSS